MVSDSEAILTRSMPYSLNPCSNGIWSLTHSKTILPNLGIVVLILVLMEYGL